MTKTRRLIPVLLLLIYNVTVHADSDLSDAYLWKAGVARVVITPEYPVWMGGYASRTSPSEGKLHDLWAKALVLEDASGNRSILITMDLLAIPKDFSDELRGWVRTKYGLDNARIILSMSHTHSGPVISRALKDIYPMNDDDLKAVDQYTEQLKEMLHGLIDKAMHRLQPAYLSTGNGVLRFQVNRRNNQEGSITPLTELKGPNDYSVPVIKIERADNSLLAIVFGYACHPTTLSINKFSGDYPGFAQIELEKLYPGATAMFFQGSAGDQNPLPRRSVPLAIQYGKELAASVERVLSEDMERQESVLTTGYTEIDLPFEEPLPASELEKIAQGNNYEGRWAASMLHDMHSGNPIMTSYPYPVGFWQMGKQVMFILGGEVLISYTICLKEIFGENLFVMAYANDIVSYIPSKKVLEEGRYEGDTAPRVYGLPAKWDPSIETLIIEGIKKMYVGN